MTSDDPSTPSFGEQSPYVPPQLQPHEPPQHWGAQGRPPRREERRIIFALAALVLVTGLTACGAGPGAAKPGAAKPGARPMVTKTIQVPGPTITKTVTNSAMQVVSVPDPTGGSYDDSGWQTTIPCIDDDGQLYLGNAGAIEGGAAVAETCTFTVVQLQPAADGVAIVIKDASGNYADFSLSPAG